MQYNVHCENVATSVSCFFVKINEQESNGLYQSH